MSSQSPVTLLEDAQEHAQDLEMQANALLQHEEDYDSPEEVQSSLNPNAAQQFGMGITPESNLEQDLTLYNEARVKSKARINLAVAGFCQDPSFYDDLQIRKASELYEEVIGIVDEVERDLEGTSVGKIADMVYEAMSTEGKEGLIARVGYTAVGEGNPFSDYLDPEE